MEQQQKMNPKKLRYTRKEECLQKRNEDRRHVKYLANGQIDDALYGMFLMRVKWKKNEVNESQRPFSS